MRYNPNKIEKKWQKKWLNEKVYEPDFEHAQKPFYNLMMFPYPSAEGLHVGNMYAFTGADIYGRFKRMQGFDVFEPIGLDGFGIHSENYAMKVGRHPAEQAKISEKNFYRQLEMIGNGFAWQERLETYDPGYYKWTQWLFAEMFRKGLAYRKKQAVNWCPSCKTVLADEQVEGGVCERCRTEVIKKELEQWFFKITDYAEKLLQGLEKIDWSEKVKIAQRNWIGRSEGALIDFEIKTEQKPNFVILHGKGGSSERNFIPWLRAELEKKGFAVQAPDLPDTDEPDDLKQTEHVLKHCKFDEKTIVLGHSFGGIVALRLLERGIKLRKVILVGTPSKPRFLDEKKRPTVEAAINRGFSFAAIKKNAGEITLLYDEKDHVVPLEHGEVFSGGLDVPVQKAVGRNSHFTAEVEPEVLRRVLNSVAVFTTRPDTLFGATYLVLGPEHPGIENFQFSISNFQEVEKYIKNAKSKSEEERIAAGKGKTGVELKGVKAINPANGEEIPVWVADYVLGGVGTGAIMAVPAHDERDFEFAKKFGLKIKPVVKKKITGARSVLMGFKNIENQELTSLGVKEIWTADKDHKYVEIPKESLPQFEELIIEKMESGFWNEYISAENIIFIFKDKNGFVERLELNEKNDARINKFSYTYNNKSAQEGKTLDWLPQVLFYKDLFIHTDSGILINSGKFNGMDSEKAKWEITKFVGGERKVQFRLRDWLISRQRYWGPPIPMIFCEFCKSAGKGERAEMPGWFAVPDKDLPVKLPKVEDFRPTGTDKSPLATVEKFYKVRCPECKAWARRETDVSDTFLDSAWYYIGYLMKFENCLPAGKAGKLKIGNSALTKLMRQWLPVHSYIGGAEHSVLHLLYVRFLAKAMYDWKLVHFDEPFPKFRAHGLLIKDGAKMSKSRGNVVNPDEYIKAFGADALRMYLMFLGPFEQGGDFRDDGIRGITRFLERVWKLISNSQFLISNQIPNSKNQISKLLHKTIKKVTEDIENLQYNTAISALMILLNEMERSPLECDKKTITQFLKLLAPFAPHITEELYQKFFGISNFPALPAGRQFPISKQIPSSKLKKSKQFHSIHLELWPEFDPKLIQEDVFELVVQINGKVRDKFEASIGISEEEATRLTLDRERIKDVIRTLKPRKIIFVPKRLINIVL